MVKRYEPDQYSGDGRMNYDKEGDYVLFTDHEAALSELQAKVNEVKHWNNNADDIIIALRLKAEDSRRREIALEDRVKEAYLELSCAGYVDYNKVRNILKSILKETEAKP